MSRRSSIVVIGGGASAVILAAQLMRSDRAGLRVTVVERRHEVGRGIAYSAELPDHRLNVMAGRMSALPDEPLHFWNWLLRNGLAAGAEPNVFVPRKFYGQYLSTLFDELLRSNPTRLRRLEDECIAVTPTAAGLDVRLASGVSIAAHMAVLATGHDLDSAGQNPFAVRMESEQDDALDPDGAVMILGSGLSMIDAWLSLEDRKHRGEIVVVSRRGLMPQPHGTGTSPIALDAADIPFGTDLSYFTKWFHELVRANGGRWRDVVDGMRPFAQQIWRNWPLSTKRRFLRHAKPWWDIHRHRIAPDLHERALAAMREGRLRLMAAKVVETRERPDGLEVVLRRRGTSATETLSCQRIYDCTGLIRNPEASASPLLRNLTGNHIARADPLGTGLDVTVDLALRNAEGVASPNLFAVGPLTRGIFFEIDAVPDIRQQAAALARRLTD